MKKLSKRTQQSSPTDKVPGGLGQFTKPSDVDREQLEKGIIVEFEHTDNSEVARDIALDHLSEDRLYYDHLKEMEEKAKQEGTYILDEDKLEEAEDMKNKVLNDAIQKSHKALIDIANKLDKKGYYNEANQIDEVIYKMTSITHLNAFIRAVKNNDRGAARLLLSRVTPEDLRITDDDFRKIMKEIRRNKNLDEVKNILGISLEPEDPELGRLPVSKHLKDVFVPETEEGPPQIAHDPESECCKNCSGQYNDHPCDGSCACHFAEVVPADDGEMIKIKDIIEGKIKFDFFVK